MVIGIYIKGSVAIIRKTSEEGNYSIRDSRNSIRNMMKQVKNKARIKVCQGQI